MENPKLDKIIKKAEHHKNKLERKSNLIKKQVKENMNPYAFSVYWVMKPEWEETKLMAFFWSIIYPLCFLSLFFILINRQPGSYYYFNLIFTASLSLLCILKIFYFQIYTILTYPFYKNWEKNMPFTVNGWKKAVLRNDFHDQMIWNHKCTISVSCENPSPYFHKVLEASMYLFCKKANLTFDKYSDKELVKWTFHETQLYGSTNCEIIGKIYRYIHKELKMVHHKTKMIKSVDIVLDNKYLDISEFGSTVSF